LAVVVEVAVQVLALEVLAAVVLVGFVQGHHFQ
jgi:hypothetical protein